VKQSLFYEMFVEFEVLTAVAMKSPIFWDVTPLQSVTSQRLTLYGLHGVTSQKIGLLT
jgi:hypothetical protein